MSKAAVVGAGMSPFGRLTDWRLEDLAWAALEPALVAAGVEPEQVDTIFVGTAGGPVGVASRIARASGMAGGPAIAVEAACASGTVAVKLAADAVESGRSACAVAIGIDQLTTQVTKALPPEQTDVEGAAGLAMPAMYALSARWWLDTYGVDESDLAWIAEKNLDNASVNPRSLQRPARSFDEILQSRMISDPLTVLQCCPISDGAAAVVLQPSTGRADEIVIQASGVAGGRGWPAPDPAAWATDCVRRVREQVERQLQAPLTTADLVEMHDAFTISEILTTEAMGLASPGTAVQSVQSGEFRRDGRLPINPSGGLLGRGHPLGATGAAQVTESWLQLRGEAGQVQVKDPRRAVVETMGGGAAGMDGNVAAILVLDRM